MSITMSRRMGTSSKGFTIVELLIVVVVIAILAAITIVGFQGIQSRAASSAVSSDLSSAAKSLEVYRLNNNEQYPSSGSLSTVVKTDGQTSYQYRVNNSTSPASFCLTGTYRTFTYSINSDTRKVSEGACAGHGVGGVAPITNLALHPRATAYGWQTAPKWQNDRWAADGTYSLATGVTPPAGTNLTTAVRFTVATARTGHGFNISGGPDATTPADTIMMNANAGQTFTISLYVRWTGTGASPTYNLGVRPARTSDTTWTAAVSYSSGVSMVSGQWYRLSHTYTVPAGSDKLGIFARAQTASDSVGDTHEATGLMVVEGSTLHMYADGSSPGWMWNGGTNTSTSVGPPL